MVSSASPGEGGASGGERALALCGLALAGVVVVLGAYTRLVDAGLGCPDWPGCYGFLLVPETPAEIAAAEARYPQAPVEADKAWPEMVHRYFASALGLLTFALLAAAWRRRRRRNAAGGSPGSNASPLALPVALVALVIVQGAFGAWTVTLKLWPQVVTAHLLGGFATLALLWWHALRIGALPSPAVVPALAKPAAWITGLVIVQVALGGWTSSNYAALACADFPACHGELLPEMDFAKGFDVFQDIGPNYLGGTLSSEARVAIQMTHRAGAVAVLFAVAWLGWRLRGALGWTLLAIVSAQFALGAANVLLSLPLAVATLHNAGAAALLLALVAVNFAARAGARSERAPAQSSSPMDGRGVVA